MRLRPRTALLLAGLTAVALAGCRPPEAAEGVVIYVVRHAERADDGAAVAMDDPPLSDAGRARARELAERLRFAGITHVHSTDRIRTRETALPLSELAGVEVRLYDASDPDELAEYLRSTAGTHLVVGHSNTVPDLVRALGGEPEDPIESLEYDRIYVLHLLADGSARSILLRYGSTGATP